MEGKPQHLQIILVPGLGHFDRFLGFSNWSPLWNNENKTKFSGNPKTSKFWKLQLSISCGTQKSAKIPRHVAKMIRPFWIYDTYKINFQVKYYFVSLQDYNTKTDFSILFCNWTKKHEIEKFCFWKNVYICLRNSHERKKWTSQKNNSECTVSKALLSQKKIAIFN